MHFPIDIFQTLKEYQTQYMEYLKVLNISKAPNITAYTYDAVWVIAAALNKTITRINQLQKIHKSPSYQQLNITALLNRTIQEINFQGITVCLY